MRGKEGVTLIEIMVVVAIVGMLAAIAIPAYDNYVTRSRRSDAFTALETVRAAQEMYRAEKGFYASDFVDAGVTVLAGCSAAMGGSNYAISITRTDNTHYTALAAATAATVGGKQAGDRYPQFRTNENGQQLYYDTKTSSWNTDVTTSKWEDLR
jgi:type IV pilus assembly protein PilE